MSRILKIWGLLILVQVCLVAGMMYLGIKSPAMIPLAGDPNQTSLWYNTSPEHSRDMHIQYQLGEVLFISIFVSGLLMFSSIATFLYFLVRAFVSEVGAKKEFFQKARRFALPTGLLIVLGVCVYFLFLMMGGNCFNPFYTACMG